ncbi:MAG: DUF3429 domain-containing protein [Halieaceae bacterium]|nr:DUF3429 domain-containing protein [Halieaceae bacterium]
MTCLGLAGLLPFLATAGGVWILDDLLLALSQRAFLTYSAAILCFLAGTLWGETLPEPTRGQGAAILVSNGVVLFVVFALLTAQPILAAGLLLLGHLAQLWFERQSLRRPQWYVKLRTLLTTVAAVTHVVFIVGLVSRSAV